ncbi:MAG TPA: monovalent cation/H+ antiporter complex subunit F [Solirubrobacteraceae bacterium]|nr:monovalent cation/H+ antiporter complex subunit F [Solirubrobacteraceae bacterium]
MNAFEVGAAVLGVLLFPCLAVSVFGSATSALVALEMAGTLSATALMLLAEGFHRQPFVDLALCLILLSIVASVAIARLMERDL